jgi:CDP-glycerol glycerophosphotransferase
MDFYMPHLALSRPMRSERAPTGAPRVSVVIPVYQVEAYLPQCLDTVLADSADDVEVVAVDDGSPDGSAEILAACAASDPRLRVVRLPTNVGLGQARNAGLEHARGEYVWFVDADDWLPAGAVRTVTDRLVATRPDVLLIGHDEVHDDGSPVRRQGVEPLRGVAAPVPLAARPDLLRQAQSACTKIARRAYLTELGLRFRPGWYEDSSFSHPLLMAAARIDVLETVCYHYRQRDSGGITKTPSDRHFEVFEQYDWLFGAVDAASGAYDEFRPELFRLMINHYLVIVGNTRRLPGEMRQVFFRRVVADYRRRLPAGGYPMPEGVAWLKHQLVRLDAYRTYLILRRVHRALNAMRDALSSGGPVRARRARPAAVGAPRAAADLANVAEPRARAVIPPPRVPAGSAALAGPDRLAAVSLHPSADVVERSA